jgi:hypothetical protein
LDPVDEEETVDLLGHRYFRASILAHTDAANTRATHDDLIEQSHIAASIRPQSELVNLDDGVIECYVGRAESEITLDSSIGKSAIALLGVEWPCGVPFERLYRQSLSLLAEHGRPAPSAARRNLLDAITVLFETGQMDLRVREPSYCCETKQHPTAHALARWEAEERDAFTTPHHLTVAFDSQTRSLVRSMDGSQSQSELKEVFGGEFVEQTLPTLGRCGLLADPRPAHGDNATEAGALIRDSTRR